MSHKCAASNSLTGEGVGRVAPQIDKRDLASGGVGTCPGATPGVDGQGLPGLRRQDPGVKGPGPPGDGEHIQPLIGGGGDSARGMLICVLGFARLISMFREPRSSLMISSVCSSSSPLSSNLGSFLLRGAKTKSRVGRAGFHIQFMISGIFKRGGDTGPLDPVQGGTSGGGALLIHPRLTGSVGRMLGRFTGGDPHPSFAGSGASPGEK
mmetsp:Transcript_26006/g.59947  ORF Transcript_26006/g.59947 Transcript_26006/m.59947 type:complete len:209 (-) Transcript_26006:312-938(-)